MFVIIIIMIIITTITISIIITTDMYISSPLGSGSASAGFRPGPPPAQPAAYNII